MWDRQEIRREEKNEGKEGGWEEGTNSMFYKITSSYYIFIILSEKKWKC